MSFEPPGSTGQGPQSSPSGGPQPSFQGDASQRGHFGLQGTAVGKGYHSTPFSSPIPVFTPGACFHGQTPPSAPNPQGSKGQTGGFPNLGSNVPLATGNGSGNVFPGVPQQQSSSTQGTLSAAMLEQLNMAMAPPSTPQVQSAFDILGKTPAVQSQTPGDSNAVIMKALTAALTGDRKALPSWSGAPETLRSWLRQLSLWELDNNTPKERWGLKLMQSFPEQSIPRRLCETIEIGILSSPQGYSAVLSAILQKYGPYIEAAAPAAIENFFYAGERQRGGTFSSYIAAKEVE